MWVGIQGGPETKTPILLRSKFMGPKKYPRKFSGFFLGPPDLSGVFFWAHEFSHCVKEGVKNTMFLRMSEKRRLKKNWQPITFGSCFCIEVRASFISFL